jgi:hypothetical protein
MPADPQVRVMNVALGQLGKLPVTDLSEQSLRASTAAMKLQAFMEDARDAVLERHGWLCAMTYAILSPATDAAVAADGAWKYPTYYVLPGDVVKIWEVRTPTLIQPFWSEIDWIAFSQLGPAIIEGEAWEVTTKDYPDGSSQDILRTDLLDQVAISYCRRCNWAAMPFLMLQAVGFDLAARGCYTVTADQQRQVKLEQLAEQKIQLALSSESMLEGGQPAIAPSIPARIRQISR